MSSPTWMRNGCHEQILVGRENMVYPALVMTHNVQERGGREYYHDQSDLVTHSVRERATERERERERGGGGGRIIMTQVIIIL